MKILYVYCYPDNYFRHLTQVKKILSSQPAQKFNKLFVEGLKENGYDVSVLVTFNQLKWNNKKITIEKEVIIEDNISYYFLPGLKLKYLNNLYTSIQIKKFLTNWFKRYPDTLIILDYLKPFAWSVCTYSKGKNIVTIVTDLPMYLLKNLGVSNFKNKLRIKMYDDIIKKATQYVFLTQQMNKLLNVGNKPSIIIEGLVDYKMLHRLINSKKCSKKICLYSGALNKQYGLDNLVLAFTNDSLKKFELHLYGSGDYVDCIKEICKTHHNIKYFGIVENRIVVQRQMEATLLINPRPSYEEYTKYSFPSKNMEYMVSGTPLLTTYLQGMPSEYLDYLYIIKDESSKGIEVTLIETLNKPDHELELKGMNARKFVLKNKNNIVQAQKIIEMFG